MTHGLSGTTAEAMQRRYGPTEGGRMTIAPPARGTSALRRSPAARPARELSERSRG